MLKQIHIRTPVIYDQPMGRQWFEGVGSSMMLNAILRLWQAQFMVAHGVSKMVNGPANDRPECIACVLGRQVLCTGLLGWRLPGVRQFC